MGITIHESLRAHDFKPLKKLKLDLIALEIFTQCPGIEVDEKGDKIARNVANVDRRSIGQRKGE